jgi:hypothetical protein
MDIDLFSSDEEGQEGIITNVAAVTTQYIFNAFHFYVALIIVCEVRWK